MSRFLADPKGLEDPWGLILKFRNGVVLVEVEGLGRFRANLVFGQDGGQTFGFFGTDWVAYSFRHPLAIAFCTSILYTR
jgi:hypothetical protein